MQTKFLIFAALAALGLWCIWAVVPLGIPMMNDQWDAARLGQWGDSFGALNALLSACAFVAVLVTLRLQTNEIARQQEEIAGQRKRLESSELKDDLQQFEATFFQLFELSRELRERVSYAVNKEEPEKGFEAFRKASETFEKSLAALWMYPKMEQDQKETIRAHYIKEVHSRAEGTLGPYFRVLYTILRRISEKEELSTDEKARYGNLVRSQLSSDEVVLIAANALTEASNDFMKFVIEFRLLKYLPSNAYRSHLEEIYPPEAFAPRD
ncbi:putative phage abortive infection protein [Rhizobium ruizarguesonis]